MSDYISSFRQGDTKTIKVDYGTGVNITTWSFIFTIKEDLGSTKIIAQIKHTAGDDAADDVANGLAFITLDSVTSMTIKPGSYYWDIQVNKGNLNPPIIKTILPPIEDFKDKLTVVQGATVVTI